MRGTIFTFFSFKKWKQKDMAEKDLLLTLSHIFALSTRDQLQSLLEALLQTVTTCPEGRQVLRMEGMVENRKES